MHADVITNFERFHGIEAGATRTIYLRSGRTLSGDIVDRMMVTGSNGSMSVIAIQLRLCDGSVISIPWHAVEIVAGGELPE